MTIIKYISLIGILFVQAIFCLAQQKNGAIIPWSTYEAEQMHTNGALLGPRYDPYQVETESSGQKCVKLSNKGQFVEFRAVAKANTMVIRYSLPDSKDGNGLTATLNLFKNGVLLHRYQISSRYAYLYGKYPFVNDPTGGVVRHFYDELRIKDIQIAKGDNIRLQWENSSRDEAAYCIIDLADLENIAPALKAPVNSLSVTDKSFTGPNQLTDYTEAFRKCVAMAAATGKTVWIPVGTFIITGDIVIPSNVTVQGAGMWYTTLTGDETKYKDVNKRVRIRGNGSNIHLADFAVIGKLNYRSDEEANDGIVGSYGENSMITNLWIEHTKVGMWIENSKNLLVKDCRLRNTMADGINFCVGMSHSTIENCTARGTGDDCFAIWPAVFAKQNYTPGYNLISHCTATLPYLANGAAIYGGEENRIKDCSFYDITQGSAILLSTTFPTLNETVNNNFKGITAVENCNIRTSGGFDHEWGWRAAVEICTDKQAISGLKITDLTIRNSLSNGLSVVAGKVQDTTVRLSNTNLEDIKITNYGIGIKGKYGLFISEKANGSLMVINSSINKVGNTAKNFVVKE